MASEFLSDEEKKMLEVELRRKIYQAVRQYAGAHFREIERKSGLATGSAQYHLNYLAKQGLIRAEKEGGNVRYFPRDFRPEDRKLMGFLRQKSIRAMILFVLTHDNCNHEQIAGFAKLSPSTVSWHLKKLEQDGIIKTSRKGRNAFYSILSDRNEIVKLLITYRGSFLDKMVDNVVEMWELG